MSSLPPALSKAQFMHTIQEALVCCGQSSALLNYDHSTVMCIHTRKTKLDIQKQKKKNERKSHCNTDFKLNLAVTYCFLCEGADMHTGSMAEGIFVFFPTIGVN